MNITPMLAKFDLKFNLQKDLQREHDYPVIVTIINHIETSANTKTRQFTFHSDDTVTTSAHQHYHDIDERKITKEKAENDINELIETVKEIKRKGSVYVQKDNTEQKWQNTLEKYNLISLDDDDCCKISNIFILVK